MVGCGSKAAPSGGDDESGSSYYAKWTNGPPSDPSFFPVAVWLQSPSNAAAYRAIGVNAFIGLWEGPTAQQLQDLGEAGMPVLCDQGGVYQSHLTDKTILVWTQEDEPDNAQASSGGGYDPCVPPATVVSLYQGMVRADPTRPVFLNLGQGVANDDWVGRGSVCSDAGRVLLDYPKYVQGGDIISFDIYPVNDTSSSVHGNLWLVAKGVDRLRQWTEGKKPIWNWIETTDMNGTGNGPTPAEVRAEVWMSIVHGSMGIGYFVHVFTPSFIEAGLLADGEMTDAVKAINAEIHDLAPVLNSSSLTDAVRVDSSNANAPVDAMVKRQGGATYLFAVGMRAEATRATFTISSVGSALAEVLGESRSVAVTGGSFSDDFDPYGVHLYRIAQ